MVRFHVGPIERIKDAVSAQRYLWLLCLHCGHTKRIDPRHVAMVWGDLTLRSLKERMRCQRCHRKRAAIVVDDEEMPGRD